MASAKVAEGERCTKVLQKVNIMACVLILSHLQTIYTPDVHQEERWYIWIVHHFQCEALTVQIHTTSGIQSWTLVILPGGSIVPPSMRTPLLKARVGAYIVSFCYVWLCLIFDVTGSRLSMLVHDNPPRFFPILYVSQSSCPCIAHIVWICRIMCCSFFPISL
jgi:hypothetical protein